MSYPLETCRITSLRELDALVGEHVLREKAEVVWEDVHGYFQFHSESEARQALEDPYFQRFMPAVDWGQTPVREVRIYRPYSSDGNANWRVSEAAVSQFGPMLAWKEDGRWRVTFGTCRHGEAMNPMVAVCLAALAARGFRPHVLHDRLDSELASRGKTDRRPRGPEGGGQR